MKRNVSPGVQAAIAQARIALKNAKKPPVSSRTPKEPRNG